MSSFHTVLSEPALWLSYWKIGEHPLGKDSRGEERRGEEERLIKIKFENEWGKKVGGEFDNYILR